MNRDDFLKTERLYHFTNRCSALKILTSGKLKFGELNRMNDINESYRQIYAKDGVEPDDVYKELNTYRQISLTHDGRFLGFAIPSMWGHYAEKGYGICLVFDKEKLLQNLPKGCSKGYVHYKINYSAEILVNADNIQEYFKNNEKALFFSKTIDWEYEQEFRIITQNNDTLDYKDSLIAVIMYFADDIKNGDSVLDSEMAHSVERIVPNIPVLEFSYWSGNTQLQKGANQWYPPLKQYDFNI